MDVAIVGMACRFPGAADYDEFWQNLVSGKNCIREVPSDRWDWRRYFGDPRLEPNKTTVKWGGFIDDIDKFDPVLRHCTERGGVHRSAAPTVSRSRVECSRRRWYSMPACRAGRSACTPARVEERLQRIDAREPVRDLAVCLDWHRAFDPDQPRVVSAQSDGRSEAVDTACSSSLVALHNAIRDIVTGECEEALVGGVNALITPTMFISHTKSGMLSPDGQCRTFSASANGYVRREGVGVLYIKPLQRALADGDHVHAVIKAGRQSRRTVQHLTSPTTEAQAAVVKALRRATSTLGRSTTSRPTAQGLLHIRSRSTV
jgi:hypothetical protein